MRTDCAGEAREAIYKVVRPGGVEREFTTSRAAVEHLVENPGFAELYGPDGLIMTQGFPPVRGLRLGSG